MGLAQSRALHFIAQNKFTGCGVMYGSALRDGVWNDFG